MLERGLELANDAAYAHHIPLLQQTLATAASLRGDAEATLRHARRALEAADRIDSPAMRAAAHIYIGRGHLMRSEFALAITELERAHGLVLEHGAGFIRDSLALVMLAEAHLGMGQVDRARELSALVSEREHGPGVRARAHLLHAQIRLSAGAPDTAEIERTLELAAAGFRATEWRAYAPDVVLARAELAASRGDEPGGIHQLREAHRLYTEMGAVGHAERVARELER